MKIRTPAQCHRTDFLFIVPVHCKKEICALRSIPYGPQAHPVHEKKVIVSKSHNNGPYSNWLFVAVSSLAGDQPRKKTDAGEVSQTVIDMTRVAV